MNEIETFVRADRALEAVVNRIGDHQWDMQVPPEFPTNGDRTYTLREIVDYQAYDEAWIPTMMAGTTIDEVGADAFGGPLDHDLLGDTPKERFADLVQAGVAAVESLDEADLEGRTVHYSYGTFSAREALWHAILFRTMRAIDIAKAIDADSDLPDDLVQATWEIVQPHAEQWRQIGVFGPAVDVPADAPLQDRLVGLTGRHP